MIYIGLLLLFILAFLIGVQLRRYSQAITTCERRIVRTELGALSALLAGVLIAVAYLSEVQS